MGREMGRGLVCEVGVPVEMGRMVGQGQTECGELRVVLGWCGCESALSRVVQHLLV